MQYTDTNDKCLGLAAMAVSLMVWDAEPLLVAIDADAPAEQAVILSSEFYLCPVASAKAVWQHNLRRLRLTSAMLVANIACRTFVGRHKSSIAPESLSLMRSIIEEEADTLCQLTAAEADHIMNEALGYSRRLFTHPQVAQLTANLASTLADRRTLQSPDIFTLLAPLANL